MNGRYFLKPQSLQPSAGVNQYLVLNKFFKYNRKKLIFLQIQYVIIEFNLS